MSETTPMEISGASLARWVLTPTLAVAVFGLLPTWLSAPEPGLKVHYLLAEATAVTIVLVVMLGSGFLTVRAARSGAGLASTFFLGSSAVRLLCTPTLAAFAQWVGSLELGPMVAWTVITYLTALGFEVAWYVTALRRNGLTRVSQKDDQRRARAHVEPNRPVELDEYDSHDPR